MLFSLRTEELEEETPEEVPPHRQEDSQHSLWVDEFAPQHYTELLSDDVRPCTCSSVPGLLVARRGELRIQPDNMSPAHSPVGMESRALVCLAEL